MRILLSVCCAALMASAASTAAAHDGAIDNNTLAAMGLSGVQIVSDQEASSVRGNGFAIAAGGSFAFVGSHHAAAGSANGYLAAGHHFAGGVNGSVAGKTVTRTRVVRGPRGPVRSVRTTHSVKVYAGGFSAAASF